MLTDVQRYFVDLMSAFIQKKAPPRAENINWPALYKLAKDQNLTGVVYFMARQLDPLQQPDEDMRKRLEQDYFTTVMFGAEQDYELQQVWTEFSKHNIIHIPVKGYTIKKCWPVSDLRTMGDIDYLVHEEDKDKTREILTGLAYKPKIEEEPVVSYRKGGIYLEEHHKFPYHDITTDTVKNLDNFWDYAEPVNECTYALSLEYHALLLLAHLAKHLLHCGCGIRQVMDISLYFHQYENELDWDVLFQWLDEMKLSTFALRVFSYCYYVFGLTVYFKELPEDRQFFERMSAILLENGIFGEKHTFFKSVYKLNNNYTGFNRKWHDLLALLRFAFPPYSELRLSRRYSYVDKKPWLVPAAILHRAFGGIFRKDKTLKKLVISAVSNRKTVVKQAELYSDIGLDGKRSDADKGN